MRRVVLVLLAIGWLGGFAEGQTIRGPSGPVFQLATAAGADTLSSSTDEIIVPVGGLASARIQTLDTYSGTWEVQCSTDGTTYDTDDELNLTLDGQTSQAQAVTDAVGIWSVNVAGCVSIKIAATAGFAASDTAMRITAVTSGGGAGGGAGSSVDVTSFPDNEPFNLAQIVGTTVAVNSGVLSAGVIRTTLATNDATAVNVADIETLLGTTNTSLGTIDNAYALSATAYAAVRFTDGTSFLTPATDAVFGTTTYTEATSAGPILGFVRNDVLEALANTNNEVSPGAVDAIGRFWVTGTTLEDDPASSGQQGFPVFGYRRDTLSVLTGAEADYGNIVLDNLNRLWMRNGGPCADHARITFAEIDNAAANGNFEIVALNGSDLIEICGLSLVAGAAVSVQLIHGTGTACATGETDISGPMGFAANGGIALPNSGSPQFVVPAGGAFCLETSAGVQVSGHLAYVRTATP